MKNALFPFLVTLLSMLTPCVSDAEVWLRDSLPETWEYTESVHQTLPAEDSWWTRFDDPVLDSLINMAEAGNFNLSAASRRVQSARQSVREARAAWYPDLGLSAGWTRSRNSGAMSSPSADAYTSGGFDLGVSMNWEIDIFGRTRSSVKAASASADATKAEYTAAMVSLCAQVAKTYVELRMYQEQFAVAEAHRESQQKVVTIAKARHEAGIGDMLDVSQALTVLYSTRASVPALEAMIESSTNALATLTATTPSKIRSILADTPARMPRDPGYIAAGVPADLLRRRPDIVEAEAQAARAAALCGVAKKDFLPTLSLSAGASTSARDAGDLFSGRSFGWSVSPSLSWTIFDGLARNARSAEARLNLEAAVDNYNETVLGAVEEVNNALANYNAGLRAIELRKDVIKESRHSFDLALDLYKQGLTPFSNVSDAMISLLTSQNSLISSEGKLLNSYISLYQALGGGF
ncbi:MAG: TolC family protein [Muribaculaceae bacterium]|nr:TolC family protein [Muribaculaceae bacterium]